ncbi:MAG: hypothetical protein SFV24_10290 [Gemmatimonadales bacterium]|nr:hypothetical protein [Gemmatimonadales bacterium]
MSRRVRGPIGLLIGSVLAGVVGTGRIATLAAQSTGAAAGGQVGSSIDGQRLTYGTGPRSTGTEYRVWLLLPRSGHLLRPDLFSYQGTFQPTFLWQYRSGIPEPQRLRQVNYALSATALASAPVGFSVAGSNGSSTSSGGAGSIRESRSTHRNASAWIRFRPLPAQLSLSRQEMDETWRNPGSAALRTATVQRILRASATNSKVAFQAQRFEYDDRLQDADYSTSTVSGTHTARWGRGSRLESGFARSDQTGVFALRRREWTERLELYHSRAVRTSYFLSRYQNGTGADRATHASMGATATIAAGRRVSLGFVANRQSAARAGSRDALTYLAPRVGLSLGNRRGGYLSGNATIGWEGRQLDGAAGSVPAIDESHRVPANRTIILDQLDVESAGIVVRSPEGTVFREREDYRVVRVGRTTELDILASGRLRVDDEVQVSYRYTARADGRTNGVRADLSIAAGAGGVSLVHQHSTRQSGRSSSLDPLGPAVTINDFADRRTALAYRTGGRRGTLEASAGYRTRERGGSRVAETEVSLSVMPPRFGASDAALTVGWSEARTDDRSQRGLTMATHVGTAIGSAIDLRLSGEATDLRFSDSGQLRYLDLRTDVAWHYGRMTFDFEFDWYRQSQPTPRSTTRLAVRLARGL